MQDNIPTGRYHYLNRGCIDSKTDEVLAWDSIAFDNGECFYLAVSESARDILIEKGHPAILDFPFRFKNRTEAFV